MLRSSRFIGAASVSLLGCLLFACSNPSSTPTDEAAPDAVTAPRDVVLPPYQAHAPRLRRLTKTQYANTVADLFGAGVIPPRALEPDTEAAGSYSVGASESGISARGTEQYQTAAYELAEQVLRDPARRAMHVQCTPTGVDDAMCAERFVRAMGRRVWRRPLETEEVTRLVSIATRAGTALMDFHRGLEFALAAMLQSPDFLFRVELGTESGGMRRYTSYELASRVSFFLWDGPPDDALLDAAGNNQLETAEGLTQQVERMLASPKARRGLRTFVADWLHLSQLDALSKDAMLFPSFSADLGPSAREEVLRTAEYIAFDLNADFRDLITTRETFVNRRLAALYGMPFPFRDATATRFERLPFPEDQPRRGLLGMAGFLAFEAHPVSTSPTLRGRYVRETLLCFEIPMPPVNVNTAIPEPSPMLRTLRERLNAHMDNPACRSCHGMLDPIGLGFENFDSIGRYRRLDNGAEIDTTGVLDRRPFTDAASLAELVRNHVELPRCIVQRLYRHAYGRPQTDAQIAELEGLNDSFAREGYKLRSLLRSMVLSPSFRLVGMLDTTTTPTPTDAGVRMDAAADVAVDVVVDAGGAG